MSRKPRTTIVDLAAERGRRRLHTYEAKIRAVLDQNRGALSRLFSTGSLFTRQGTRAGRDLLLAHQHLLRVVDLLGRLEDMGEAPGADQPEEVELIYRELDDLLEKTSQITAKTLVRSGARRE